MTYNDLVAFLDILGFENLVKDCVNRNNFGIIQKIDNAMDEAKKSVIGYGTITPIDINLNQFSDCVCVSMPDISNTSEGPKDYLTHISFMLLALRSFQITLLESEIYIRGGLSSGFHYESSNIIFSEGLIKSYKLESKSIYPRIILDKELAKLIMDYYESHKHIISNFGFDEMLLIDSDGIVFINPFSYYMSLKKSPNVYDLLKRSNDPNIHRMLKKKLNQEELEKVLKDLDKWYFEDVIDDIKNQMEKYQLSTFQIFGRRGGLNGFKKNLKKYLSFRKIFKKFSWLYELFKWTNDPKSSKIKFEYFLK